MTREEPRRREPTEPLLDVRGLSVAFGPHTVVRDVSFEVHPGEVLGVVGPSGAGKTVTALALVGLLPRGGRVTAGTALWQGRDLLALPEPALRGVRGREIAMVFQDALGALHPSIPVLDQVAEAARVHAPGLGRREARARAAALLDEVGVPSTDFGGARYPHEWSGGMRQRAVIAMATANQPHLILADEPTTALDAITRARVLETLLAARRRTGAAMLLITHDWGVVASTADRVLVLDEGRVAEKGPVRSILTAPSSPRTAELLAARPAVRVGPPRGPAAAEAAGEPGDPLLRVRGLSVRFGGRGRASSHLAVDGVDLDLWRGETLGLVGESGAGKTTIARVLVGLCPPTRGRITLPGPDGNAPPHPRRVSRSEVQIVFQDPYASLNPRRRVASIVAEPLRVHRRESTRRVAWLLERVGLSTHHAGLLPHQLSGGQRQRVAIARALALDPAVLVADEPVSSLDAPVQARVLALLDELRRDLGLGLLLISHDLGLVRAVSDRVAVLHAGRIVEVGPVEEVCDRPAHPFTRELLGVTLDPALPAPPPGR